MLFVKSYYSVFHQKTKSFRAREKSPADQLSIIDGMTVVLTVRIWTGLAKSNVKDLPSHPFTQWAYNLHRSTFAKINVFTGRLIECLLNTTPCFRKNLFRQKQAMVQWELLGSIMAGLCLLRSISCWTPADISNATEQMMITPTSEYFITALYFYDLWMLEI